MRFCIRHFLVMRLTALLVLVPILTIPLKVVSEDDSPLASGLWFLIMGSLAPREGKTTPCITFRFHTNKVFGSMSYRINSESYVDTNKIEFDLVGIAKPGNEADCALGPATQTIIIDVDFGEYDLIFNRGVESDRYKLAISEESIDITSILTTFTRPHYSHFIFAPKYSVSIGCDSRIKTDNPCEEFINFIQSQISFIKHEFPIRCCGPYPWGIEYYTYSSDDFEILISLFEEYSYDIEDSDRISNVEMYTWEREIYCSWLTEPNRNYSKSGEWGWWFNPLTPNNR